jgi:hypothetical protein
MLFGSILVSSSNFDCRFRDCLDFVNRAFAVTTSSAVMATAVSSSVPAAVASMMTSSIASVMLFRSILIYNYGFRDCLDLVNRALAVVTTAVPTVAAATVRSTAITAVISSSVLSLMMFRHAQISRCIGDWLVYLLCSC